MHPALRTHCLSTVLYVFLNVRVHVHVYLFLNVRVHVCVLKCTCTCINHFVCNFTGGTESSIDDVDNWEVPEEIEDLKPSSNLSVKVSVIEASGLPAAYSHNLFCQYKFWGQEDALIIPPLITTGSQDVPTPVGVHQFQHSQIFNVEVNDEFLDYLQEGALAVEVWGHRRSGFMDNIPSESGNIRKGVVIHRALTN